MSIAHSFALSAFGCNIRATAGSPETLALLDRNIFPPIPRVTTGAFEPDLDLRAAETANGHQLSVNGAVIASALSANGLLLHVLHVLDETVVRHLDSLRAIHAGAVLWQGRVLLFPGSTHSGKSSLTAELLRRGAQCMSDEYALVDPDGRVHPYPRPLLLRDSDGLQTPTLPSELNATFAQAPAPAAWIFTLQYDPGASWSIDPVPQSVALIGLLRNTPHALADVPDMAPAFQRLVAGAVCYQGHRPNAAEAAEQILDLIAKAS
jgi:hypothetical protein